MAAQEAAEVAAFVAVEFASNNNSSSSSGVVIRVKVVQVLVAIVVRVL